MLNISLKSSKSVLTRIFKNRGFEIYMEIF
jgi:hypothetical protein